MTEEEEIKKAVDLMRGKSSDSLARKMLASAYGPLVEEFYLLGMAFGYEMALAEVRGGKDPFAK
jgi:hypothetical protein